MPALIRGTTIALCAAATILFAGGEAGAQMPVDKPGIALERFLPPPGTGRLFAVPTARTLDLLNFSIGLTFDYARAPLRIPPPDVGGDGTDIIGNQVTGQLLLALGLGRVEVGLGLPVSIFQNGSTTPYTPPLLSAFAIGDLRFDAKLRLTPERWPFAAAVDVIASFPSGGSASYTGEAGLGFAGRVVIDYRIGPVTLAANAGYRYRTVPTRLANLYLADEILAGGGAQLALIADKLDLFAEAWGSFGVRGDPDGRVNPQTGMKEPDSPGAEEKPLEALAGLKLALSSGLHAAVAAGPGLSRGYGTPTYRVALGIGWARVVHDSDGDGVPNESDKCPLVKEDKDGFEDGDGCPDPDNDQDGVPDGEDRCPNQAEDRDKFQDDDGCPDPDNDKDGIVDLRDRCPNQPEDKDGIEDDDGCPDLDNDGDGVDDDKDKCPRDPEDRDGFEDTDGCPDPDNDKDGVPDAKDRCPNQPEDKDGFDDQDGCPDPDNDSDGLVDAKDKCPNEPETFNGFQDDDGCPDKGKALVKLGATQVEIQEKVFFDSDSARIKPQSFKLLNTVAIVINLHPELKKILIAGHTDDRGSKEHNRALSKARAESVLRFMVDKGVVEEHRLEAQGLGPDQPIVPDAKRAVDREKNRRVEFVIVERSAP
ncbi:MAG: OmpA family protein [Myxococcales bacterium]|nr:OmpA family protein [Myxococcales bacterium]